MARPGSTVIRLGCVQKARWGDPGAIAVDQEFGSMLPAPTAKEREHTEETLLNEGCREPLVVWPWHGRQRLLLGYDLWPTLFRYRLPFRVVEKSFPDRQAARFYVIREHLERRCLGPLGASYLRGMRYQVSKQPHGGDRISAGPAREGEDGGSVSGDLRRQPGHDPPRCPSGCRRGADRGCLRPKGSHALTSPRHAHDAGSLTGPGRSPRRTPAPRDQCLGDQRPPAARMAEKVGHDYAAAGGGGDGGGPLAPAAHRPSRGPASISLARGPRALAQDARARPAGMGLRIWETVQSC